MIMESWMVSLMIASLGLAMTYGMMRSRLNFIESQLKVHKNDNKDDKLFLANKTNICVQRGDNVGERVAALERDFKTVLDLPTAELKFVSKIELELHLKNIALVAKHTDMNIGKIASRLEELVALVSRNK